MNSSATALRSPSSSTRHTFPLASSLRDDANPYLASGIDISTSNTLPSDTGRTSLLSNSSPPVLIFLVQKLSSPKLPPSLSTDLSFILKPTSRRGHFLRSFPCPCTTT